MSAVTVPPAPVPSSSRATVIDDRTPVSPLEVDYASRFEGWSTSVRLLTRPVYESDGYRFAGALVEDELLRAFTIRMYAGSTLGDLRQMQHTLQQVRAGMYARLPWNELADGRRVVTLSSTPSGGPLVQCREPGCLDYLGVHALDCDCDPWHVHRALILEDPEEQWRVEVFRIDAESEWRIELLVGDEYTGDTAAALALALSTAADEARRLNALPAVSR
ncbi:hypothetical protein [Rathayibacter sp. Leaf248]|uniref:hypothetical protein n=1 Tax=Rathayibacter sp. Leaf248 TaxID=2876555 RepID=UPI001E64E537|nr:hypothetical protein [Rathayibacter sp. Leaf248]